MLASDDDDDDDDDELGECFRGIWSVIADDEESDAEDVVDANMWSPMWPWHKDLTYVT